MTDVNFKAAAAVAALSALFLAGCSDGAKTEPPSAAAPSAATAPAKTETSAAPSPAENTALHPYDLKGMRFDEAAQALAHATGCTVRYTDQELSAMKIAPVVGTMSIKDAVAAALAGSPYTISNATDEVIEVTKK